MEELEGFEINSAVRGEYSSVDMFLVPKGKKYVRLMEKVMEKFGEEKLELVIDESSMPLPYYEALEIPLDVFEEKYEIEDEEDISTEQALSLAEDLLELGLFDIGFRGEKVSIFISHNGYINIKPENIEQEEFQQKIESVGVEDEQ